VKTLLEQKETAGYKRIIWDGKNEKGQVVSSGIYFYSIQTKKFTQSKKMLLLK
jgi:flagellar hook assembly protein FlgD